VRHNQPPTITLLWPRQDATLQGNAAILWSTSDPESDPLTIDLYYSDNDGVTWYALATNLEDVGYYVWQVSFLPPGATYRLKAVAHDACHWVQDQSKGVIAIQEPGLPAVSLVEPWAGSTVQGIVRIGWQTAYAVDSRVYTDILIRAVGDSNWRTLVSGLRHTSDWLWDTAAEIDGAYELAVRLRRGNERSPSGVMTQIRVSNGEPVARLRLTSPAAGELLTGWRQICWESTLPPGTPVALELSADGGGTWHLFGEANASAGCALWDTDGWPSGDDYHLRLRAQAPDGSLVSVTSGRLALGGRGLLPPRVLLQAVAEGNTSRLRWSVADEESEDLNLSLEQCDEGGLSCRSIAARIDPLGERVLASAEDLDSTGSRLSPHSLQRWPAKAG